MYYKYTPCGIVNHYKLIFLLFENDVQKYFIYYVTRPRALAGDGKFLV